MQISQLKMNSMKSNMAGILRRGEYGCRNTERKWPCKDIGRDSISAATSPQTTKIAGNHQKTEGTWENSSLKVLKRHALLTP